MSTIRTARTQPRALASNVLRYPFSTRSSPLEITSEHMVGKGRTSHKTRDRYDESTRSASGEQPLAYQRGAEPRRYRRAGGLSMKSRHLRRRKHESQDERRWPTSTRMTGEMDGVLFGRRLVCVVEQWHWRRYQHAALTDGELCCGRTKNRIDRT